VQLKNGVINLKRSGQWNYFKRISPKATKKGFASLQSSWQDIKSGLATKAAFAGAGLLSPEYDVINELSKSLAAYLFHWYGNMSRDTRMTAINGAN
jgi:hypothetical protein